MAKVFDLTSGTPVLSNLLAKSGELDAYIHKTGAGFDVQPGGIAPNNSLQMLSAARFKTLLKDLTQ